MSMSPVNQRSKARVIALDVGGMSVKSAVVAPEELVIGKPVTTPVDSTGDAQTILSTFVRVVAGHLHEVQPSDLLGVALGFPGPFDYAEGICRIRGVEKYESIYAVNIREALQTRLGLVDLAILFRNDAEAAIAGEARYGAGRGYQRLIGVTLGTGCGSAFIVNGAPVTSGPGVPANGWLYPVLFHGRRADDVFSRRGLEVRLRSGGATVADVKEAAQAARAGDAISRQVFEAFGADLGLFLDPLAMAFKADAVLVLGQIAGAIDIFGPPLRRALSVPALRGERGADAALLGAADLLFNR